MVDFWSGEIKDILPHNLLSSEVTAISYAVGRAMQAFQRFSQSTYLYAKISCVPDEVLDLMALEVNTQYYSQDLPRKVRELLVMQTLAWYMHAGTPSVLCEFLGTVLDGGYIEEWYSYEGKPYHFRAYAETGDNEIPLGYGTETKQRIETYKNVRSWLEYLVFVVSSECLVNVEHESSVSFFNRFYPRGNAPLKLNGKWKLDGRKKLGKYENGMNLYPSSIQFTSAVQGGAAVTSELQLQYSADAEVSEKASVEICMGAEVKPLCGSAVEFSAGAPVQINTEVRITVVNQLNGKWKLNGKRKLNGGLYIR